MGTTPETEYESSPDVATDGSLQRSPPSTAEETRQTSRSSLRTGYYKIRATFLAPLQLLREYLVPVLAFLLVAVAVLYLLGTIV